MNKKLFVFIDASNLWEVQKSKKKLFDLEKLKKTLKERHQGESITIFYYTAYPQEGTREYSLDGKHKFYTYLEKGLGFKVVKKPLKRINVNTSLGQVIKEKGNMDVEIAIDSVHHIQSYDTALFFTGDSDFLALISYIKNRGKEVYIYSSENNISTELRTGGNGYYDLLIIPEDIWGKDLQHKS